MSGIIDLSIAALGVASGFGAAHIKEKHEDKRADKEIMLKRKEEIEEIDKKYQKELSELRKENQKNFEDLKDSLAEMRAIFQQTQAINELNIKNLTDEVREHNNFAKRMPVVEEQIKVANHRIEDLEKAERRS